MSGVGRTVEGWLRCGGRTKEIGLRSLWLVTKGGTRWTPVDYVAILWILTGDARRQVIVVEVVVFGIFGLYASGKVADAGLQLVQNGSTVQVLFDSKLWSQSYLSNVMNDPQKFNSLVGQIQGYQLNPANNVAIEFINTQNGPVSSSQLNSLWQALSSPTLGLDMNRLSITAVNLYDVPSQTFASGVH